MDESKWSKLSFDILMKLAKLSATSTNIITLSFSCKLRILQFRAVCKSWRSVLPLENKCDKVPVSCNIPIPIPMAPLPSFFPSSHGLSKFYELSRVLNGSFYLVPSTSCILQSVKYPSSSHLLIVEHLSYESNKVCCRRPFFTTHDRSSTWEINSSKSINLLDYRVSVVAEEYCLRFLINDNGVLRLRDSYENLCKKAVLILNLKSEEELDGVAIVLFDDAILAQYSFTENKWNVIYDGKKSKGSDIVKYEDGCIVLDHKGNAFRVAYDFNSRTLGWTHIAYEIRGCRTRRRLVVDSICGDLYLVVQNTLLDECDKFYVSFSLYWFSEKLHKWERNHSIPGLILCVGIDFSFTANSKDFPTISSGTGNCILSTIDSFKMYQGLEDADHYFNFIGDDCCVFNLGEHIAEGISGCYRWPKNDYRPMFDSPSKWEELNVPPLEKRIDKNPGVHSWLAEEDEKVGSEPREHVDPQGKMVSKEERKKKKRSEDSDHSDSSKYSRLPKARKVNLSSTEHPGTEETPLALMKKLVACLENNPVPVHTVEPRCTLPEVLQDLGSLPNVEVGSNFYFSSCLILHKKQNREAYMCLANAVAKYKWLNFMCKRSEN